MDKFENIKKKVEELKDFYENAFLPTRASKEAELKKRVAEIEELLKPLENDNSVATEVLCLRGLALSFSHEYNERAEKTLTQAVKHSHSDAFVNEQCWCALAQTLWKKGDLESAQQCLLEVVRAHDATHSQPQTHTPTYTEALCDLSILCRQLRPAQSSATSTSSVVAAQITDSINYAKKAIETNINNPKCWYTLGNATHAQYFHSHSNADLNKLLKAYKRAETLSESQPTPTPTPNPDLFYNRAGVFVFTLRYPEAEADLARSAQIDPALQPSVTQTLAAVAQTRTRLKRLFTLSIFVNKPDVQAHCQALNESSLCGGAEGFDMLRINCNATMVTTNNTSSNIVSNGKLFATRIVASEASLQQAQADAQTKAKKAAAGDATAGGDASTQPPAPPSLSAPYYYLCVDSQGKFGLLALFDVEGQGSAPDLSQFSSGATVVMADPEAVLVDVSSVSAAEVGLTSTSALLPPDERLVVVKMTDKTKVRVDGQPVQTLSTHAAVVQTDVQALPSGAPVAGANTIVTETF